MGRKTRVDGLGRWLQTLQSDVSEEDELISTPYNPIVWSASEVKDVTLRLTEPEFMRLCSALSVGSTITYPENPFAVYWSFLRNYEYPIPMTTCDAVLECILNNEAVQAALAGAGSGAGFEAGLRERGLGKFDDALSFQGVGGCENDNLFGAISQMLSALNSNNIDFFESVEVQTNLIEFMGAVGQITGADEASVVDVVSAFVGFTQENFAENYAASYTDELYDQMRCDIFCIARINCELTLNTFWEYFNNKMSSFNLLSLSISDILQSFVLGEYTSDTTVYAFMWLQLAVSRGVDTFIANLTRGTVAFGAASRLLIQMISFSNDPDSDWTTLCDDCNQPDQTVTFDPNGWPYTGLVGTVVANVGNPNAAAAIVGFAEVKIFVTGWSTNKVSVDIKTTHNNVAVFIEVVGSGIVGNTGIAGNGQWQTVIVNLNAFYSTMSISIQEGGNDPNLLVDNIRPL